ncbi:MULTISPECIES: glycosyltransferase family 2 protein [Mesonia]|uniref:Dodecaprenyl-phosphate galacturonate synthase n=1 Tax=Mesonia oceanica TaxID=2687242 RepID=A0AC61Y9M9_9FLAO|nr:glycosyltransferase family 2 protein [Mesonia oceanica]MAN27942.1 glycosyltransferase [Mesonia sp.]MAQ41120.1 glycosyltransferase [Mesonia sp.]VVV01216.1 Dodecaprenyl-phosphate galacturonate synthase [Mesonia oceanica]|tara:strand:+ start:20611 stop:21567 length:957 start_codon:yes stop_codon:yes gene_type:complete
MTSSSFLSIIIPVYNEDENVLPLTKKIETALINYKFEIIYIDDFSTDNTVKNIKSLQNPNIKLIELKKNYGQSLALAAGIDNALGDFIISLDGDMQNDPNDIPNMLKLLIEEDIDLVTGIRVNRKDSFFKKIPSKIANYIIRKTTKLNIQDQGCALKVFRKETAKELNLYGEMHRFIALLAFLNGTRIKEVPVKHHPRKFGKSKYGLGRTFKVINDLLLILFQRNYLQKPLYLFGNIGLFFFSLGLLINIYLLIEKILGFDIWGRPILIVGVLFVLLGIQLFTIGIVIDLQMRTYYESQDKRPYIIRKITLPTEKDKK